MEEFVGFALSIVRYLCNALKLALWSLFWRCLLRPSPRIAFAWRRGLLRLLGPICRVSAAGGKCTEHAGAGVASGRGHASTIVRRRERFPRNNVMKVKFWSSLEYGDLCSV